MKRLLIAVALLMSTTAAFGDSATTPDYSRDAILKVLHDDDVAAVPFKINIGSIDINTRAVRYHFNFLPFLASIPYAGPQGARYLPNPFVLTHTEYAWRAHQYKALPEDWTDDPEYSREYNRTAKMIAKMK